MPGIRLPERDREQPFSKKEGWGHLAFPLREVPWAGLPRAVRGRATQVVSLAFGTP